MTLRMYSVVTVLLFPVLISAQTSSSTAKSQSTRAVAASSSGGSYPTMSNQAKQRVQQLFEIFESGQTGAFWAALSEGAKKSYGSEEKFAATQKKLQERLGTETKMVDEIFAPSLVKPGTLYSRLSEFSQANQRGITHIAITEQGQVEVFQMGPETTPSQGRYGGYKDLTKLMLPFAGQWFVFQGGRSAFQNGYFPIEDQRFSLDFVLLKNGRPFSGEGSENADYYCFGQPVLAPADGLVVDVEDGYQDNTPGRPVADSPKGNLVLISHGNSEFSLIDHLKQNSVKVKKGDKVKQGDAIAECGNSGPSAAPAVHFQLQNSAGLPLPDSLPAQFVDYVANGKPVAVGEPVRGQTVSNASSGRAAQSTSTNQASSKTPPSNK